MAASSRRNFLAAGLALPAAGTAAVKRLEPAGAPAALSLAAPKELKFGQLGKTGLKVTRVAFGTMVTSDQSVVEKAIDMGINYFDTAVSYQGGNCEAMVGAAIKGKRQKLVISTKSQREEKESALADLETSLKRLGTDYVDIWYIHAKSRAEQLTEGRLEAQEIAKKKGMIRFSGVSTHSGFDNIIPAAIKSGKIDVILTAYNFTMGSQIDDLLAQAKKAGVGVVAMKVMAGGFRRVKPGSKLGDTLKKEGAMMAALKWVLRNQNVDTAIPSITDMDQLEEDMRCMWEPFTERDQQILAQQMEFIRPLYCRSCGHCEELCPKGLPVSDLVRFAMYADGYGQYGLGRERFLELPEEIRSVRCRDCKECTVKCPNGVAVVDRLIRAQELFG